MGWDLYEPYLLRLTGLEHIDKPVLNDGLARLADALLASAPPKPTRTRKVAVSLDADVAVGYVAAVREDLP